MNILILGGTGAMGKPTAEILIRRGNRVTVTTRKERKSNDIIYVTGDAHDTDFLRNILKEHYDAIVDFLVYNTPSEFEERARLLLSNTEQYIFLSSARIYSDNGCSLITEEHPRLLDVCSDQNYLKTDEYALAKARCENVLKESGYQNYTIVRPYITYNDERMQLGVFEKETWLRRALKGKKIVFSKDLSSKYTTMTYGMDVALRIADLIGKKETLGEIYTIAAKYHLRWGEVLDIYLKALEKLTGKKADVTLIDSCGQITEKGNYYQTYYDRMYDRCFDNSKIENAIHSEKSYTDPAEGLQRCLNQFLESGAHFQSINWKREALLDRQSKDKEHIRNIPGEKNKIKYVIIRYFPEFIWGKKVYHQMTTAK